MAYRGQVALLPIGQLGFTGTENPSQAQPGHFLFVDGAELDGGITRKEGGASKLNGTALTGAPVIVSGIHWTPTPGAHRDVIYTSAGAILKDTGGGTFGTTMASGLPTMRQPPPFFLVAGGESVGSSRRLMFFGSATQVRSVDGDGNTISAIANPAADWSAAFPTFGVLHGSRVWAGGNGSDPHRIYYSTLTDHRDFLNAGSGTLPIFPGEGETLAGGISFRGLLILWKYPTGIYAVDTRDPTPANWRVTPITRAVGTLNQHTIVHIEGDILYLDRIGSPHSLSATDEFGDVNTSNVGDSNDIPTFMRATLNLSALRRAQGMWFQARRQAWFSLPMIGTSDNNLRMILAYYDPAQSQQLGAQPGATLAPRFLLSRRDVAVSLWMRPDSQDVEKPAFGDASGFVWLGDQTARNKDGVGYQVLFETASMDLSHVDPSFATRHKTGQFLELLYETRGDWDLTVEIYWDDVLTDIVTFNMGSDGAALGSFVLDTDVLGGEAVSVVRKRISGSGRRIKLRCLNNGVDQDISLANFHLSFVLGDERTP